MPRPVAPLAGLTRVREAYWVAGGEGRQVSRECGVSPKFVLRGALERVESGFDAAFTPALNPLYQLGALGWFFYWIVAVSGIYLYVFFDTGVEEAYASIERITHVQWYAGGVMRSLHRYASDALVVVVMLHLLREYVLDRMRGARWLAWLTGVPLLWLMFAAGVSGYWVVWDELAQYVAVATTEWLDALPLFGEPIARNFLHPSTLSSRFFTLLVFIHIFVPLAMLFVMWIHIQRLSRPRVNPPRLLALGTLAMLLALSMARPAVSHPPADLSRVPGPIDLDWFYLFPLPLQDHYPGYALWAAVGALTLLLFAMPWLPPMRRSPAAVVDLDNCNGCGRCVADCPFDAVTLRPRTDGAAFAEEAVVDPDTCVSCGLCVGACPSATPFRRRSRLSPGIDLPDIPVAMLREQVIETAAAIEGPVRILVFGCRHGVRLDRVAETGVGVMPLPCIGHLPPSFIDFLITRGLVDGVLLTGCRAGDCHHRQGIDWVEQRLGGRRDPYLRRRVPRERVAWTWLGVDGDARLRKRIESFREALRAAGPYRRVSAATRSEVGRPVASDTAPGGG